MSIQYIINDKHGYPRVKLSTDKLMYNILLGKLLDRKDYLNSKIYRELLLIRNIILLLMTLLISNILGTIISELLYPMSELQKITF